MAGGPFIVIDADDSTFVIDVDGTDKRVNSDHITPAPRLTNVSKETKHPLFDGFDKPRPVPASMTSFSSTDS